MTHKHRPYRESRTIPVNPVEMQELVKQINLKSLQDDPRDDPSDDIHLEQ